MKRRLNLRLCLALSGTVALVALGTHFLHAFQAKRAGGLLIRQAEKSQAEGNLQQAVRYYGMFLGLEPKRSDVRAKYGLLLANDKLAKTPREMARAFLVLEQALREGCEEAEVRRRLIQVAMQPAVARFTDASDHIDWFFQASVKDAELLSWRAECHEKVGEITKARACYEEAIRMPGRLPGHYVHLAELLRRQPAKSMVNEKTEKDVLQTADQIIDDMLAEFKDSPLAFLSSAGYHKTFTSPGDADQALRRIEQDLSKAFSLAPTQADVLLASADFELERQQPKKARAYLERGIEQHAKNWRMYQGLARVEIAERQPESAVKILRQGLAIDPNQNDLLWNLAQLYLQTGQDVEAEKLVERLTKLSLPQHWLDYLNARLLVNKKDWRNAVIQLERTYPQLLVRSGQPNDWVTPGLAQECGFLLADCFERLGDSDRASAAYSQIVAKDPLSIQGRLGLARVEWASGRSEFAIQQYRQLITTSKAPVVAWIEYVQLLLIHNRRSPRPDWSQVLAPLENIAAIKPVPVDAFLIRAEVYASQKQFAEARAILENQYPSPEERPVEVWIALSVLEERQGKSQQALEILHQSVILNGDKLELRIAKARHFARQGGADALKVIESLGHGTEKWPESDQHRLTNELASAYWSMGENRLAEVQWLKIAQHQQNDVGSRLMLFDVALRTEDEAAMARLVEELKGIEDPNGTLWRYCEACRLIWRSQKKRDEKALSNAGALLAVVAAHRSRWSRATVAQAQLDEEQGKFEAAIRKYREAIFYQGNQDPAVIRRIVALLSKSGRYREVDDILQRIGERGVSLSGLDRVAAEVALAKADSGLALTLAQKAVSASSKDYRDHIWLGRVYAAAGQSAEAEAALSKAIELNDTKPEPWVALVIFYFRTGKKVQAEAKLLEAHKRIPKNEALVPLAQCHEMIGQNDQARDMYETALAAKPEDLPVLQALALFYLRQNERDLAKEYLQKIIDLQSDSVTEKADARRLLAVVLETSGDYSQTEKALELMGIAGNAVRSEEATADANIADERAKVFILARQSSPRQRLQAIAILEKLGNIQPLSPDEQFLLAQLHEKVGEWPKAREQFMHCAAMMEATLQKVEKARGNEEAVFATIVAHFCGSLLRHDSVQEAELWFGKLEKREPNSLRTLAVKAQLLAKQGRPGEAVPILIAAVEKQPEWAGPVCQILEEIGQIKEAEQMCERFVAQSRAKSPESVLVMVGFLGRRNRPDEALALCEKAWQGCKPEAVASACMLLLYTAKCGPNQRQRVAMWLERESAKKPKNTKLLSFMSALRHQQKDYRAVVTISRRILELDKTDAITMNNLAWILALKDENAVEALQVINQAIAIKGPQSKLLDTKAVVFMKLNDSHQAIKALEDVVADEPTSSHYFHLAQAHLLANNRSAAVAAFQHAKQLGLDDNAIDPLEQRAYQDLQAQLDGSKP